VFKNKKALLLDMNNTFMFGEDCFDENEDFYAYYEKINGSFKKAQLNKIIIAAYDYLSVRYTDVKYRHNFPSVKQAIEKSHDQELSEAEIGKIVDTFAFHELGHIPQKFINALFKLKERFVLAVVIDIWSPKKPWIEAFEQAGINKLFSASSFSSDHGMVKPSPKPFERVYNQLNLQNKECLVIGDSVRRDLGGAMAAGIECVLVGGATDLGAVGCYPSLLEFSHEMQ